ncbi:uncharacterized protein LOC141617312 [Silene latifolia]|uniref:uncharacterized protein LOC141617312 n=1 Tax=Silene latifolia TaxID=37657 RepID=UPI003D7799FD
MEPFRDCVTDCGVIDIVATGSLFTWNNKQKPEERIYSRLDRVLVNKAWCDHLPDLFAQFQPEGLYDHTPCIVSSSKHVKGRRSFKYFNMWGRAKEFIPLVRSSWHKPVTGTPMFRLVKKLESLKSVLRQLNRKRYNDIQTAASVKKRQVEEYEAQLGRDPTDMQLRRNEYEAVQQLKELSVARDSFLSQKAKHRWIKEGDSNSAFFHCLLRAQKHGNKVLRVEDTNGTVCDTPEQINQPSWGIIGSSLEQVTLLREFIGVSSSMDHVAVLRTVLVFLDQSVERKLGRLCLVYLISSLLDQMVTQKAYDTVEWSFVEQLLSMRKFRIEFQTMVIKGDAKYMMLLLQSFSTFSKTSRLNISATKSNAYFRGVPDNIKQDILRVSGFSEGVLPFKYLGMPIQTTRLKKVDCACLVEKICYRIHSYAARKFSYAGRLVLMKSFLWDNGTEYRRVPLVAWDRICRPKEEGGLGLRDLGVWNKAMVGRLVAWVAEKKDTIWVHRVHHNHLKGKDWMDYIPPASSSWVWRRICSVKQDIVHGFMDGKWVVQPAGYTPTGCYEWLMDSRPTIPWHKVIWNVWVVPKQQFLGWLVAQGALNTHDKLIQYGLQVEDKCLLCGQVEENMAHMFFDCQYSRRMIKAIQKLTGCQLP